MPPRLTDAEREALRAPLRTLRIIVFALLMGVSTFAGYSVYTRVLSADVPAPLPGVALLAMQMPHVLALAAAAGAAVLAFIIPPFIPALKIETGKIDSREIAIATAVGTLQMRTIIACSLLDAAAFFNAYWVFTDASYANLAMVGVLLFLMLMHFPLSGWYFGKIERLMGVDPFAAKWDRMPG